MDGAIVDSNRIDFSLAVVALGIATESPKEVT